MPSTTNGISHGRRTLVHVKSHGGTIKLTSLDPFNSLVVDPNFLSIDFDIKTIAAAPNRSTRMILGRHVYTTSRTR